MLKYAITSVLILIVLVSCKKEVSNQNANIEGNYKFVSLTAHSIATTRTSGTADNYEATTYTNYITQNNTGTVKIDGSTITTQNIAYSVDTTMISYINDNGTKDTVLFPFVVTMPPSSGTTNYKTITADSIYCPSGSIFMNGTAQASVPTGVKVKTDGNKLYMTFHGNQTNTQTAQGETIYIYDDMTSTITLQKM
jgi:hypothetical protein